MRVIQRLMGVDNPIATLRVYEHTLHFRNGVATIDTLTEREIHRLRTFGFRVERDGLSPRSRAAQQAAAPTDGTVLADPPTSEEDPGPSALGAPDGSDVTAAAQPPTAPAKAKTKAKPAAERSR